MRFHSIQNGNWTIFLSQRPALFIWTFSCAHRQRRHYIWTKLLRLFFSRCPTCSPAFIFECFTLLLIPFHIHRFHSILMKTVFPHHRYPIIKNCFSVLFRDTAFFYETAQFCFATIWPYICAIFSLWPSTFTVRHFTYATPSPDQKCRYIFRLCFKDKILCFARKIDIFAS